MVEIIREEIFADGQTIFTEGGLDKEVYVVLSGAVDVLKDLFGVMVVVDTILAGEVFGEMAFIAGIPRTATAQAVGETKIGVVDIHALSAEMEAFSPIWRRILQNLVFRLKRTTEETLAACHAMRDTGVSPPSGENP